MAVGRAHRRPRAPGSADGITVFVASSFDGTIEVPGRTVVQEQQTLEKDQKVRLGLVAGSWTQKTPLKLEAPTAWSPGFVLRPVPQLLHRDHRRQALGRASVAVVQTPQYGYWSIQAMRWLDPPAIENPDATQKVGGRKYMLFYQGDHLHMVAWKEHGTLYWVLNTLDNQLSNDLMMGHRDVL